MSSPDSRARVGFSVSSPSVLPPGNSRVTFFPSLRGGMPTSWRRLVLDGFAYRGRCREFHFGGFKYARQVRKV